MVRTPRGKPNKTKTSKAVNNLLSKKQASDKIETVKVEEEHEEEVNDGSRMRSSRRKKVKMNYRALAMGELHYDSDDEGSLPFESTTYSQKHNSSPVRYKSHNTADSESSIVKPSDKKKKKMSNTQGKNSSQTNHENKKLLVKLASKHPRKKTVKQSPGFYNVSEDTLSTDEQFTKELLMKDLVDKMGRCESIPGPNEDMGVVFSGLAACVRPEIVDLIGEGPLKHVVSPLELEIEHGGKHLYLLGGPESVMEASSLIHKQLKLAEQQRRDASQAAVNDVTGDVEEEMDDLNVQSTYREEESVNEGESTDGVTSNRETEGPVSSQPTSTQASADYLMSAVASLAQDKPESQADSAGEGDGLVIDTGVKILSRPGKKLTKKQHKSRTLKNLTKKYKLRKWCLHQRDLKKLVAAGKKIVHCKLCAFQATDKNMRMHMLRRHPDVVYKCEVCGFGVGIRYELRRHRLKHFNADGNLTEEAKKVLADTNPTLQGLTLSDLETNFTPIKVKISQKKEMIDDKGPTEATQSQQPGDASGQQIELEDYVDPSDTRLHVNRKMRSVKDMQALCGLCSYVGEVKSVLLHQQKIHTRMEYLCPVCGGSFKFIRRLRSHFRGHANSGVELDSDDRNLLAACQGCDLQDRATTVRNHTIDAHPISLICTLCNESFDSDSKFKFHYLKIHADSQTISSALRVTSKPPQESHECKICKKVFKHHGAYLLHCKSHIADKVYGCKSCSYTARKRSTVDKHYNTNHVKVEDRTCNICHKVFTLPSSMKVHRRTIHKEGVDVILTCPSCPREFTSQRYLETHVKRVHKQEKHFFCRLCGKGFFSRAPMLEHERSHTAGNDELKQVVCSYCGHRFRNRCILAQHENIHTGNKPYLCTQCDKRFCHASELAKHRRAHSDERPHRCQHCGKAFKFRYKLSAHMTIHTKQGRHRCQWCFKVFTANATLQKHNCKAKNRRQQALSAELGMDVEAVKQDPIDVTLIHDSDEVLNSELLQQVAEAMKGVGMDGGVVKQEGGEGEQVQVMYMCGVCNALFHSTEDVNEHMADHDQVTVSQEEGVMEDTKEDTEAAMKSDTDETNNGPSNDVQVAIAALTQMTR